MHLQAFFALSAVLPAMAVPIAGLRDKQRDVADVATVLIGVTENRDAIRISKRDDASVADVATVLIGVSEKRAVPGVEKRHDASVADVATVLIGVADEKAVVQRSVKRKAAVPGAYAKFVEEAEAHPEDILG